MKNNAAQLPQIFNRKNQSTLCRPPTSPTAVTAPTMHCVVDTGIPKKEAVTTVSDAPSSADDPREGDNMDLKSSNPPSSTLSCALVIPSAFSNSANAATLAARLLATRASTRFLANGPKMNIHRRPQNAPQPMHTGMPHEGGNFSSTSTMATPLYKTYARSTLGQEAIFGGFKVGMRLGLH
ncbi:hypothetical protein ACHAXH_005860 [Discostella pseudostelligera]